MRVIPQHTVEPEGLSQLIGGRALDTLHLLAVRRERHERDASRDGGPREANDFADRGGTHAPPLSVTAVPLLSVVARAESARECCTIRAPKERMFSENSLNKMMHTRPTS